MNKGKVVIVGGSGFIGTRIARTLSSKGWSVVILDQNEPKAKDVRFVEADLTRAIKPSELLERPDAVINLVGRPIAGRWSKEAKQQIYDSRIEGTARLVGLFEDIAMRPQVFINASAVGLYGNKGDEELIETSQGGEGFLARVAHDWEREARGAERYGIRVTLMRQGTVIGKEGGYLNALSKPLLLKLLPSLSDGKSWFSWIHADDLARIYERALTTPDLHGPVNAVSPAPILQKDALETIARITGARIIPPIPFISDRLLGGFGRELSFSQRVLPHALIKQNFEWMYPRFETAVSRELGGAC